MIKYDLSKDEEKWLRTLYGYIQQGERSGYRAIRTILHNDLPRDFDPSSIDIALTGHYKGEDITLVGIDYLDPQRKILDKTNKVILCIREFLLQDFKRETVTAEEISKNTNIPIIDVCLILDLADRYTKISNGAQGSPDMLGYQLIRVEREDTFNAYLYFQSIEECITEYILKEKERKKKRLEKQNGNDIIDIDPAIKKLSPVFKSRIEHIDLKMCFVLMPFTQGWSRRVYNELIRQNLEPMGIQCLRADNLSGPIIMEDIWVKINQAAFVIADVTGKNPNVMYEMGIVHTLGKPSILLTQEIQSIPFDFSHLRHHSYEDNVEGFREMGIKLKQLVKDLYEVNYPEFSLTSFSTH